MGFMLGGAGLMIMQPAIPMIFVDILQLSYTKMLMAIAVFKSLGYIVTTPFWVRLFRTINIYRFCGFVTILIAVFPFLLLRRSVAYCFSLLRLCPLRHDASWQRILLAHVRPHFSKEKDSTIYSSTNVLATGIKGCLIPPLGTLLYTLTNSVMVMIAGSLLGLLATVHFMRYASALKTEKESA
ncbi:MAG: hypothetical protein LVR00_09875 [Rhabdochlamydiaceae bacterium]|jgi:hypothetical protein